MTVHYRAQFQTRDGRTHAVVDTEPITVERLLLAEALLEHRVDVGPVPPLLDLSLLPADWISAARSAVQRSA